MGFRDEFVRPKTTVDWLLIATMVGVSFVAPHAVARVVLEFIKETARKKGGDNKKLKNLTPRQISRAIYDMKRRKVIKFENDGDKTKIVLTEKGKERQLKFKLENIKVPQMAKWDGKWRMLMFDIPESDRKARNIFRETIKRLGFAQFQQSVWIYPYPCEDEIDFVSEYYKVAEHINLITVAIDDDHPLRVKFGL